MWEFYIIIFPSLPKVPPLLLLLLKIPSSPLPSPPPLPKEKNTPRVPQTFVINFSSPTKKEKRKKVQTNHTPNGHHHHGWSRSTLPCLSSDGRTTYRAEPPAAGTTKNKWKNKKWKMNKINT